MSMKLREALRAVKAINDGRPHDAHGYEINDIIEEALAAPVRNCDVGTAKEQADRFAKFCLDNHSAEHLCSKCPLGEKLGNDVDLCQIHWAQMPYEEGGTT